MTMKSNGRIVFHDVMDFMLSASDNPRRTANLIINDFIPFAKKHHIKIPPFLVVGLSNRIESGELNHSAVNIVLTELYAN